jgi:hypothetical protein
MAEAINHALGWWAELNVFCSGGAVAIENNVSEREMKRVVLNRKNSLFVGHPRGRRTAAILAGLTCTCRRHDVDPQAYLTVADEPVAGPQERTYQLAARSVETYSSGTAAFAEPALHIPLTIFRHQTKGPWLIVIAIICRP